MARRVRRWLMTTVTGVAVVVLAVASPSHATGSDISDEDDCTMTALSARCTRG
jgi:hypothetical protein